MVAKVGLVSGTWGHAGTGSYAWWRPPSVFTANLRNAGLELLDERDYFDWNTALDGVDADHATWACEGKALYWWWAAHGRPGLSLVGHSHGPQCVAHALAYSASVGDPMYIEHLVTAGTPVRKDMAATWAKARPLVKDWTHVYTEEVIRLPDDLEYQKLGSLSLFAESPAQRAAGRAGVGFPLPGFTRLMPLADRNVEVVPATTHHGLVWPRLWNDHDLWQYLK